MRRISDISLISALLCAAGSAFGMCSCRENQMSDFSLFRAVEGSVLHRDQWFDFCTETDTLFNPAPHTRYDIILVVRHTPDFPNQILWLATETASAAGDVNADTIGVRLRTPDGRPTGRGVHGIYSTHVTLAADTLLRHGFNISVAQGMKEKGVAGVTDIGIVIRPSRKN